MFCLKEKEAIKNEFHWIFMQLKLLFFAFPLGVTRTTALRKPIVRFTGPEGIKRLTGAVGFWYSNLDTLEYF